MTKFYTPQTIRETGSSFFSFSNSLQIDFGNSLKFDRSVIHSKIELFS